MTLNLTSLNVRRLRDPSKCVIVFADDGAQLVVLLLPLNALSSRWLQFMCSIELVRDASFSDGWRHSLTIQNSLSG